MGDPATVANSHGSPVVTATNTTAAVMPRRTLPMPRWGGRDPLCCRFIGVMIVSLRFVPCLLDERTLATKILLLRDEQVSKLTNLSTLTNTLLTV